MDCYPQLFPCHSCYTSTTKWPCRICCPTIGLEIREYLSNTRGSTVATASIQQRPVLILLDRNFDLASMFSHSWIYQCMVSDVFQLQRNTIKITKHAAKDGEKDSTKNYDVDPKDFFWNKYSQLPFPDAVESADAELNAYKNDAKEVTAKTGISSLDDIDPNANATANIQQAVEKLPELTARKATLDMHMDILSSLINELQAKNLDKYFEIEQNATDPKVLKEFLELLVVDSERDSSLDKLRTFIILTLLVDLTPEYIEKVKSIFKEKYPQVDLSSFNYILKFKEHSKLANLSTLNETSNNFTNQASQMNSSALLSGLSSKLYGLTEGKISEGLTSIATRIKSFIPEKKLLPITTIVEAIMDPINASQQSVQLTDEYVYLDPKSRGGHSKPPKRQSYQESLVFVVGGGNYLEYQNLQEWANDPNKAHRKVIYGSTEITSASEFLEECSVLGS
ncbi:Sec1 family protein [Candida albicans]|uniref:Sec1 family protein n=1 Tax=Candida albicans TaxID=5476 RepID=A0A8H6F5G2_CANAX|nr:Sec1 family protein [Candida albicans]